MRILATGDDKRIEELKSKFIFDRFTYSKETGTGYISSSDVIFDLNADENASSLAHYSSLPEHSLLILCAVKKKLLTIVNEMKMPLKCAVVGLNSLPTFINRMKLEVCFSNEKSRNAFSRFATERRVEFLEVRDRVGMVTPRVICMIINEAYYSLEEGVASAEDIDKAMKLGTNYPFGPFEWCDRIGIKHVYETLEAIQKDTQDERYLISGLLKEKYLKGEQVTPEMFH